MLNECSDVTGGRHEADTRGQRPHPAPVREVHRPGAHQQQRGQHVRAPHGRAARARQRPPVGARRLDLLSTALADYSQRARRRPALKLFVLYNSYSSHRLTLQRNCSPRNISRLTAS